MKGRKGIGNRGSGGFKIEPGQKVTMADIEENERRTEEEKRKKQPRG